MSGLVKRYKRYNHTEKRADGLCACNCGEPVMPNSAFASKSCQNRVSKRYRKERELAGTATPDYTRRAPRHNELHHYQVEIQDPQCGDPYWVGLGEFRSNCKNRYYLPGTVAIIGGEQVTL